jgi:tRNA U34 5-methylaminomethyl-2-thiouridine-forming methyltransferase MnmC
MDTLRLYPTADGSLTFFSELFQEAFHSLHGAKQESEIKYVGATGLPQRAREQSQLAVLDVCYGLGFNTAATLDFWYGTSERRAVRLDILGLENNGQVPLGAIAHKLTAIWHPRTQAILAQVVAQGGSDDGSVGVTLNIADARQSIQTVRSQWADAIYLDPFSPRRCPQLWTVEFLSHLARCLKPDGYLVTYSCAAAVRGALLEVGLQVGSTPPLGRKAPGTIAAFVPLPPLSCLEQELLNTRAAIPYRDPTLSASAATIVQHREREQTRSDRETSSSWRRRHPEIPQ